MTRVIIRIPIALRRYTYGADEVWVEGSTVGECLADLREFHPGIGPRLFDEEYHLRSYINVFCGPVDVRFLQGLRTPVDEGVVLSIVLAGIEKGSR